MRDFFCPETPNEDRVKIIERFGITHIAWRAESDVPALAVSALRKLGNVVYDRDGWTVVRVQ